MIEYKAVAMDLDDTLLTSDLQISEETKQTLLQCQKDGMHVILASGRPIYAIEKYAKELELEKYVTDGLSRSLKSFEVLEQGTINDYTNNSRYNYYTKQLSDNYLCSLVVV